MQRRHFLKNTAATLAASGYLGTDWLHASTAGEEAGGHARNRSSSSASQRSADSISLKNAVVVTRPGNVPNSERTAAIVLAEELAKRTGIHLKTSTTWPKFAPVIAITSETDVPAWAHAVPTREAADRPESRPDGYRIYVEARHGAPPVVWILGGDARGTLFGVGNLLRRLDWGQGAIRVPASLDVATAPVYPIRGHQLGYRATPNTYDAWDPAQFEQYIRELTFFGANSVEGIPFQDTRKTPVMKFSRRQMNRAIGEICNRYGLDYWVWLPAEFDLKNNALRAKLLDDSEQFFRDTPTFTAVSFPGGDPGDNPPELVLPFLSDLQQPPVGQPLAVLLGLHGWTEQDVVEFHEHVDADVGGAHGSIGRPRRVMRPAGGSVEYRDGVVADLGPVRDDISLESVADRLLEGTADRAHEVLEHVDRRRGLLSIDDAVGCAGIRRAQRTLDLGAAALHADADDRHEQNDDRQRAVDVQRAVARRLAPRLEHRVVLARPTLGAHSLG